MITWDEVKRATNLDKHDLDFADVADFEFETALIEVDGRKTYGEVREVAIGPFRSRLCVLVFVRRDNDLRVISFRKANEREMKRYVES